MHRPLWKCREIYGRISDAWDQAESNLELLEDLGNDKGRETSRNCQASHVYRWSAAGGTCGH